MVITVQVHPRTTPAPPLSRLEDADLATNPNLWASIWELVAFLSPSIEEATENGLDPQRHTWDPQTAGIIALEISAAREELTTLGWWETTLDCFAPLGDRDGRGHLERATYAIVTLFSRNQAVTVTPRTSFHSDTRVL